MAKAKKLPSGSWRVQVYAGTVNGKRKYKSFTAASKREAEFAAAEFAAGRAAESRGKITVAQAMENYLEARRSVISPSTFSGYQRMAHRDYKLIEGIDISNITQADVQRWATNFAASHSPKTQRNAHGFLSAVLRFSEAPINLNTRLSQKTKFNANVPTDDIIAKMLTECKKDHELHKAILLAAFGSFRRSEICAFTADDIHGNSISVNKAVVRGPDLLYTVKPPKSDAGYRTTQLPREIIAMLPTEGRIVNLTPDAITRRFTRLCDRIGFHCRFHDLRHYYASFLHAMGVPDKNIMELGGWHDVETLRRSYEHATKEKTNEAADLVQQKFSRMQHEMQHEK